MKDQEIFESNIKFYSDIFKLDDKEKESFIKLSEKLIKILSESEKNDLDHPLIQECIYKSIIFIIQSNKKVFINFSKEEHINNFKNFSIISRCDIQKNFKDVLRISTVMRNINDFINQLSNSDQEIAKYPLEVLNDMFSIVNFKRKLDEVHNSFFDSSEISFLFKKLIWGVFICLVNQNDIKSKTYEKAKLFFTICQDILMRIPNRFYQRKFANEMKTVSDKNNIIKEYFNKYLNKDINNEKVLNDINNLYVNLNIFKEGITLEGEELSNKEKIENIIRLLLYNYYEKNILIKLSFDQRIFLLFDYNGSNSDKNKGDINNKNSFNFSITCSRELFKEEKESKKSRKLSFQIEESLLKKSSKNILNEKESSLIMTTYTRIWTLLSWAKKALAEYNDRNKYINNLQKQYKPNYTEEIYNKFIPINSYVNKYMNELIELLNKNQVDSKFEIDLIQFYIYCLSLIIENDIHIFSESFTALLLYNDEFIKASFALSFELALTIFDITEIELNSIYEQLNLDVYDFWKVILPIHTNLYHAELLKHLEEIDYQLSTFLLWRNPSEKFKNELKDFLENETIIKDENEKHKIFKLIEHESLQQSAFLCHNKKDFSDTPFINENFKKFPTNKIIFKEWYDYVDNYNKVIGIGVLIQRIMIYCITLNKFIFNNFCQENNDSKVPLTNQIKLDDHIIKESQLIIKVILTNYEDISILWKLHIDQFVLCCIILVLDKYNLFDFLNVKNISVNNNNYTNSKINKNILHNSYKKSKLSIKNINEDSHIFLHVKVSDQKFMNLTDFYNEIFKKKFIKYSNNISNIKIKTKIDYFDIQKDLNDLLVTINHNNLKNNNENNDEDDDEFAQLDKPTKKLKINEQKYIILYNNEMYNKNTNSFNNKFLSPINKGGVKTNVGNKNESEKVLDFQTNNDIEEELISLLKKINIWNQDNNQNKLNFNIFSEEKYSAYRNDNLKLIYNNIIKSELPPNEENRKTNKEKLNKVKELIKSKIIK